MTLPRGWQAVTIGDIGEVVSGGTPSTSDDSNFGDEIPWITPADLTGYKDIFIGKGRKSITAKGLRSSSARIIPENSILFSSRAPIGYVAIASNELATNQGFKSLVPGNNVYPKYVYYYLKSAKPLAESMASGTTFKELSGAAFKNLPIPLAPLSMQKQIVAKIEELFSELEESTKSLASTIALLNNLHLSVLNSSTKDDKNGGYAQLDFSSLLVPGRDSLKTGPFGTLIGKKDYTEAGIPIIGIENIGELRFINNGFKKHVNEEKFEQLKSHAVRAGDVLISRSGTVGEICVVPEGIHGIISTNLIRVRLDSKVIKPEYFVALFKGSSSVLSQVKDLCKGSSRLFLNQGIMKRIRYPVPSIAIQEKLLSELEELLSQEGALKEAVHLLQNQSLSLRQSILSKAFKGELA